jgi:hypothetical protein
MDPKELLTELMRVEGVNPNALATLLKKKSLQSQIHKFLSGVAKEPRRTTLGPVAAHYKIPVEAFYDPALAAEIMQNVKAGLPSNTKQLSAHGAARPSGSADLTTSKVVKVQANNSMESLLKEVSSYLKILDEGGRRRAGMLLADLAVSPDDYADIAGQIQDSVNRANDGRTRPVAQESTSSKGR